MSEQGFKKLVGSVIDEKREERSKEVVILLASKRTDDATDLVRDLILEKYKIYTIRNDENNEMWVYDDGIYLPTAKTYIKEECDSLCREAITIYIVNRVILKIEIRTYIGEHDFFQEEDKFKMPVQNGVLDLKTKKIESYSPKYKFFNKLPITFKKKSKCPVILNFFSEILKNKDDLPLLQELFGFLLLRDYKFEKAFMFLGTGRNGKGKTIELMKRFLNPINCANVPLTRIERDQFALESLHTKLANLSADISAEAMNNTGTFKSLCGHDLISAPRKFKTDITFVNYAKLIFAANTLPITKDLTDAFFNRWIILDFPFTFLSPDEFDKTKGNRDNIKIADTSIIDKISTEEELSGLLNWALIGLERLFEKDGFSNCKSISDTKTQWLRKSSSFNAFIMDCLEEDYDEIIPKQYLKRRYIQYCKSYNLRVVGDKRIKFSMEEYGAYEERLTDEARTYCWKGVKMIIGDDGGDGEGISGSKHKTLTHSSQNTVAMLGNLSKTPKNVKNKDTSLQNIYTENDQKIEKCNSQEVVKTQKMDIKKQILVFFNQKKEITTIELYSLFPENLHSQVDTYLKKLKNDGIIFEMGPSKLRIN